MRLLLFLLQGYKRASGRGEEFPLTSMLEPNLGNLCANPPWPAVLVRFTRQGFPYKCVRDASTNILSCVDDGFPVL
jgi:hypothetical protein